MLTKSKVARTTQWPSYMDSTNRDLRPPRTSSLKDQATRKKENGPTAQYSLNDEVRAWTQVTGVTGRRVPPEFGMGNANANCLP